MRSLLLRSFVGLTLLLAACQSGSSDSDPDAAIVTNADASVTDATPETADAAITTDGGIVNDGGILNDGGVIVTDGGPINVGEVCQKACTAVEQCFAQTDPSCVAECSADLQGSCSPSEIAQIGACADGSCANFESCLLAVPCIGGGGGGGGGGATCGDGICSAGECNSCAGDCPGGCTCDDVCTIGPAQDASCGPCQATVCAQDSFCCDVSWDSVCTSEAESLCGKDCPSFCGDSFCDMDEAEGSCPQDCSVQPLPK